ncbi:hypothetical protein BO98_00680 [Candidatus Synechococcus spongiarum LMB bulk10D]|nr:hypothetical protein BO98_00680 [Candidatus Synechococcus spongiarum LMB bulk10D]
MDGTALAVSAATVEIGFIYWSYDPSPDWTDEQTVSLSLTLPAPTGLSVTAGDASLGLTWTAPSGTVTGYDVQYTSAPATGNGAVVNSATATGSNPATAWVAVTRSGTTASQTISSLSNNTAYRVRVRAKNSNTNSAWVFGTGTPAPTPTVTLSVSRTSVPAGENVTLTVTLSSAQAGWVNVNLGSQAGTAYWRKYSVGSSIYIEAGQTTGTTTISTNTGLQSLGTFKVFISGLQKHTKVGNLINATPSSAPLTITITASRNADLAALSATQAGSAGGAYSALDLGAFAAATTSYTATVPHATTHVKLRLRGKDESSGYIIVTPSFPLASVQVSLQNGATVQKTSNSDLGGNLDFGPIALRVGENPLRVRVTAQDGTTTKDYTVTVTRERAFKPTGLRVTPGDGKLDLSWTAPATTVTGYDVHYTSAAATGNGAVTNSATASGSDPATAWVAVTRSGTTASQTISSLSNGTTYRVRVRAKNSSVNGDWVFGTGTVPSVITIDPYLLEVEEGASSVVVTLTVAPPLATASSVRLVPNTGGLLKGLPRTITLPAATASVEVDLVANFPVDEDVNSDSRGRTLLLEAVNNAPYVLGDAIAVNAIISDNDLPAAPAGLSLTPADRKLTASWTKPAGRVAGYELRYKQTSAADQAATTAGDPSTGWVASTPSGTVTSAEITGLTNGTAYHVQVRANDGQTGAGNGWGDWSASQTGTPANVPAAPTNFNVAAANTRLELTWTAPAGTLTGYDVQYTSAASGSVANSAAASGSDPATAWVAVTRSGTTATQAISSLSNGTPYRVRVRARNSNGNGAWAFGTGTPAAPSTPTLTTTTTTTPTPTTPTTAAGVPDQSYTEGTEITPLELPEATGGNRPSTYTLSPSLPEGLTLNDVTRRLSGTPTSPQVATRYTWTATDANGDAARTTFTVTVVPDKPSFDNVTVPDQSYTEGTAITPLELPEATGGNNPLTYTLTPSPPNGLRLNEVTRRLSGSPISPQDTTRQG